jgi:class 3 adenylate cyclase
LGEDRPLPTGVVTFLMTDVEGSTRMWEERPEIASFVVARHEALIGAAVGDLGGALVKMSPSEAIALGLSAPAR